MSSTTACPGWDEVKRYCIRSLQDTECFCGGKKLPYSALCKPCYFSLEGDIRERMMPVMAAGLFARAGYEMPRVAPEFWDVYPLLIRDCLLWLREHTQRMEGRNVAIDLAA